MVSEQVVHIAKEFEPPNSPSVAWFMRGANDAPCLVSYDGAQTTMQPNKVTCPTCRECVMSWPINDLRLWEWAPVGGWSAFPLGIRIL